MYDLNLFSLKKMYNLNRIIVIIFYYIYTYVQVYTLGKKWDFVIFFKKI